MSAETVNTYCIYTKSLARHEPKPVQNNIARRSTQPPRQILSHSIIILISILIFCLPLEGTPKSDQSLKL
jgi:hypothetical protein